MLGLEPPQHLGPIEVRQPHIEQNDIRRSFLGKDERAFAVLCFRDFPVEGREVVPERVCYVSVVRRLGMDLCL